MEIQDSMSQTRKKLLENFDEEVNQRLKTSEEIKALEAARNAKRKSFPFLIPAQPISGTARTSYAASSRLSLFGKHSSSRMRAAHQQQLRFFQGGNRLLPSNSWEVF